MYYQQTDDKPCAYITKNKQRIKQFGQNVYLKDGSEFEIELYNGSRKTVLSKIKINGEFIAGGGIILRPGERVFLERYLDVPNKFKFETYTVDSTNETMNAIANNGDVEILFYDEEDIIDVRLNSYPWGTTFTTNNFTTTGGYVYGNTSNDIIGGGSFRTTSLTSFNGGDVNNNNIRSNKYDQKPRRWENRIKKSKSIETGRVEKGSSSNQEFKSVSKNFNSWTTSTSVWKILPESQRPVEKRDLIEKCPKCSTKVKKSSWKFCPECGHQLVRSKTEIHYTMDTHVNIGGREYLMQTYNDTLDNFLKRYENKLIYIKSDSLTSNSLRAIVID
jgi:DNA-directed RNA polymerase subunit M/transcription elongation factor TFIIS